MRTPRRTLGRLCLLGCCAAGAVLGVPGPGLAAGTTAVTASVGRTEIPFGGSVTVSGTATLNGAPAPNQPVALQDKPYGAAGYSTIATATTNASGRYRFKEKPPRSTLYRTTYAAAALVATSPTIKVTVDELVDSHIRHLALGRVRVEVSSKHDKTLEWGGKRVYWFLAEGTSPDFK